MILVLDTNVVVSALIWGGNPGRLIRLATDGEFDLATSPALLAELREVLARPHLASRLESQRSSVDQSLIFYGMLAVQVSPLGMPAVVELDPDDDAVLACALAAGAGMIVSGDRHLLDLREYQGIPIVPPSSALERIAAPRG
jgi:hypothetical protein